MLFQKIHRKLYLVESKLRHGHIPASFTNFSEHSCLSNHLQEHILSMSKSEHMLSLYRQHLLLKTPFT